VKGLGTLGDYITKHTEKGHTIVTFHTMKVNVLDQQAARDEKKALKARKAQRQRAAHELRVERHVTRQVSNATH
jgi:glutamate dehydrogenase/leucine dehydrogenase